VDRTWPSRDDVGDHELCVADGLDVYREETFSVSVRLRLVTSWRADGDVGAIWHIENAVSCMQTIHLMIINFCKLRIMEIFIGSISKKFTLQSV